MSSKLPKLSKANAYTYHFKIPSKIKSCTQICLSTKLYFKGLFYFILNKSFYFK